MNKRYKTNKKMRYLIMSFALLVMSSFLLVGCSTDETQTVTNLNNLVLQDEFDVNGAPNPAIWTFDIGRGPNNDGWGNNELQYYTDRPENIVVENGMLKITARQEQFEGAGYTSARILSKDLQELQYGRFEARMKLPWGKGMWPAFWLLGANIDEIGWPFCGEIDVMENAGSKPTIVSSALHGPGYSGGQPISKEYDLENERVDTDFHIYGIEWGPGYINFYIDDVLYNQITPADVPEGSDWVFDQGPFFMLINLAVGGNFDGPPNQDTVFPQTLYVDYVRVYQ